MIFIFFICGSVGSAHEVAHEFSQMTSGVSPLPSDCYWVQGDREQRSVLELVPHDVLMVKGEWFTCAKVVTRGGHKGFSVGKPFTS